MSVAFAEPAVAEHDPGRALVRLLVEYRGRLEAVREVAVDAARKRSQMNSTQPPSLDIADQMTDACQMFDVIEPAADNLVRHASQWLDHSAPRGSAEEFELSVRLAEFEALLKKTSAAVAEVRSLAVDDVPF